LGRINLTGNQLNQLDSSISTDYLATSFDFTSNLLQQLPSVGLHGPILKRLCFDQNYLCSLDPLSQSWLPNLHLLSACQNRITEIPELFCPQLKHLLLGDNQISDWSSVNKTVKNLSALKYLNIENNPCVVLLKSKDNVRLFVPSLPSQVEMFLGLQNDQNVQLASQVCSKSDQNSLHNDKNGIKDTVEDSDLSLSNILNGQTEDDSDSPSLCVYLHPVRKLPPKKSISCTNIESISEKNSVSLKFRSFSFGSNLLEKLKLSVKSSMEQSVAEYNIQVPTVYQIHDLSWVHLGLPADEELSVTSELQKENKPGNVVEAKLQQDRSNELTDMTSLEEDTSQPTPTETKYDMQTGVVLQSLTSNNFMNVQENDGPYINPSEEVNEWKEPDWINSLLLAADNYLDDKNFESTNTAKDNYSRSRTRLNGDDTSDVIMTDNEKSVIKPEDADSMVTSTSRSVSPHSTIPSQGMRSTRKTRNQNKSDFYKQTIQLQHSSKSINNAGSYHRLSRIFRTLSEQ
ncbi:hypothetical protein EG68_07858, partial [Paragonimus skrjabini miyazakii]